MEINWAEQRSLAETPTWSVATVTTVMIAVCFALERSIYRFGKWLKKTRRKSLFASLQKIKEELMLLGLISLMLGQCARWISKICVKSSLFSSRFYPCVEGDFAGTDDISVTMWYNLNESELPKGLSSRSSHHCNKGYEPFVSYESLEQLHRFLFLLGITHVLYSGLTVALAMVKIYSWRKWENLVNPIIAECLQARRNLFMKRQTTFISHHATHPWSKSKTLIWMLCFIRQFKTSVQKSDYMALRLGFITNHRLPLSYDFHKYMVRSMEDEFHGIVGISWSLWVYAILCIFVNVHVLEHMLSPNKEFGTMENSWSFYIAGLNVYFWLSFIPAILVMLVGTKLEHVVAQLALEVLEARGPSVATQVKPRDNLFWFGKPEILLWLIQFITFQNAFEMATFIWSLWSLKTKSCFVKNHWRVVTRLVCGVVVQFWCSYSTVPLNVIVIQMGSKCKKALIAESVRDSLHSWCKRVKEKSKRDYLSQPGTARSVCSIDEEDETITVESGTLSRGSSITSERSITLEQVPGDPIEQHAMYKLSGQSQYEDPVQLPLSSSNSTQNISDPPADGENDVNDEGGNAA